MKKLSLLILLSGIFFSSNILAQDPIIIDPVSGNSKGPFYIEYGKSLDVIYKHINVFKVKANGLFETINVDFENADIFDVSDQSSESGLKGLLDDNDNDNHDKRVTYLQDYKKLYSDYVIVYQDIQRLADLHDYLKNLLKVTYIRDIGQLKNNIKSTFSIAFKSEDESKYKQKAERFFSTLNDFNNNLYDMSPHFSDNALLFVTQRNGNKRGVKIVSILPEYEKVKTSYTKIMSIHDEILENKNEIMKKIYNAIELYIQIQSETFERRESTGSITSDVKLYTPRVVDFDGTVLDELQPIRIKTIRKLKINTSAGYLLSFIGNENYGLRKDPTGNVVGVSKQSTDDLTHAVGALFHAYLTRHGNAAYGISTGISLTEETNVGFYLGASGMFLEKNRLVFSAGLSFTKQNFLNTSNLMISEESGKYDFISENDTEIKYDSLYKPAFFFGITYNLFNNEETE